MTEIALSTSLSKYILYTSMFKLLMYSLLLLCIPGHILYVQARGRMVELADIQELCYTLDEKLEANSSAAEEEIHKHLSLIDNKYRFTVPDIPEGLSF